MACLFLQFEYMAQPFEIDFYQFVQDAGKEDCQYGNDGCCN